MRKILHLFTAFTLLLSIKAVAQCPTAADLKIRVNPTPIVGSNTVCTGQPFTVEVDRLSPPCGGFGPCNIYTWTFAPSGPPPTPAPVPPNGRQWTINNPTVFHSGTYTVTVDPFDPPGPVGPCAGITASILVNVSQTPKINNSGVLGNVCYRDSLKMFVVPDQANTTKNWEYPDGTTNTIANDTLKIPNVTKKYEGSFVVRIKNTDGCESDPAYINVKVQDSVVADFEIVSVKPGRFCKEDTVTLRNKSTENNSFLEWDFDFDKTPGRFLSTDPSINTSHIYPYLGKTPGGYPREYAIRLRVGKGQCFDTAIRRAEFNHPLVAGFDIQGGKDSICQGLVPLTFDNKTTDPVPGQGNTYVWRFEDGNITTSTEFSPTYSFTRSGVGKVTLISKDYLDCVDSFSRNIFVDSTGPVTIVLSDVNICPGKPIVFRPIYPPIGLLSTLWNFGDGNISTDSVVSYNYDNPSTYTVKFQAKYRICPDALVEKVITVKPNPIVNAGVDTVICPGGTPIQLMDKVNSNNPNAKFRWNTVSKDSTSSIIARAPGVYAVTTTIDGCSTTDSVTVEKNCYIDIPNAFTPNGDGTDDYFLPRQLLSKAVTKFTMSIYNRWGTVMFETTSTNGRGWDGRLNGEPQPVGVYVYLVEATLANGATEKYQGNLTLLR